LRGLRNKYVESLRWHGFVKKGLLGLCESHSRAFDEDLPWVEKLRYQLHYCLCLYCRRFAKQLNTIEHMACHMGHDADGEDGGSQKHDCCQGVDVEMAVSEQTRLSEAAVERIRSNLPDC